MRIRKENLGRLNPCPFYPGKYTPAQKKADPFRGVGMARWRRQLSRDNMDKVIVFYQDSYGIFNATELGILSGMRFKASRIDRESTARILERYGIDPSP